MREHLSDFILVPDSELRGALRVVLETTHNLAEPAGAASVAAAFRLRERLAGKKVALSMSGGNITLGQLKSILDEEA
jgi:threonine dehydratase